MEMSKFELINIKIFLNAKKRQLSKCGSFPRLG